MGLSSLLGWINYDFPLGQSLSGIRRFMQRSAIDLTECLGQPEALNRVTGGQISFHLRADRI